jgi:hypothetical protein
VRERLDALARSRGMEPADLLAELVLQAEIGQLVDEVNIELERLVQAEPAQRERRAKTRQAEETVESWTRV